MPTLKAAPPSTTSAGTPLAYRVVRGGLWVAASSYFNVGFGFLANLVLTRLLAPEHFGIFALAQFYFSFINLGPKLGVGQAFAQRRESDGALIGTHFALSIVAGATTIALTLGAVPVLRALGVSWDVIAVAIALATVGLADSMTGTAWILLDKALLFGHTSVVASLAFPLSYLPGFWLALRGGGYWSIVAQHTTYALLLMIGLWWTGRRRLPDLWLLPWRFDRSTALALLRFGLPVGLAVSSATLLFQFDNFLIGTFVGLTALGFYERAYRMAQWPHMLVTSVVSRTAFYTYAHLQDDRVRLEKSVGMVVWLLAALTTPLALAIFVAAPQLVTFLYGDRWLPTATFVRLLVVYSLARPILDNAGALYTAVGRPRLISVTVGAEAAILVVAGFVLTLRYGAIGTAIAVGIAFGAGLVIRTRYVRQIISFPLWTTLGAPLLAAALTLGTFALLRSSLDGQGWPLPARIIVKSLYVTAVFFAILWALQPRLVLERVRYVGQLLRAREQPSA